MTTPDALSLSRVPIGIAVAFMAAHHSWNWALMLLLLGCYTDVMDGLIAKQRNQFSRYGGTVLEPVCDLFLVAGALAGLILAGELAWSVVIIMAAIAGVVQIINSFMTSTVLFKKFGVWFMPCYFLLVIWLLVIKYAFLALTGGWLIFFLAFGAYVTLYLIVLKRHRFAAWFKGDLSVTV